MSGKYVAPAGLLLLGAVLLRPGALAQPVPEQRLTLGVVNGQVRDNQRVEVVRVLPRGELLSLTAEEGELPGSLELSDATGAVRGDGQLALHLRRPHGDGEAEALMTVRLEADGRPVAVQVLSASPLTVAVPAAVRRVSLTVTEPVRLLLPRSATGEFALDMAVTGYAPLTVPAIPEVSQPGGGEPGADMPGRPETDVPVLPGVPADPEGVQPEALTPASPV